MVFADIGDSVQRGFDEFAVWVPRLAAFLAILIIGYILARIVGGLVRKVLERVGFDQKLHSGTAGTWVSRVSSSPSSLFGTIAFWLIFVAAVSIGLDALGIQALEDFVATVWAYVPNVIAALLIFLVAGALAVGVATLLNRTMGETTTGRVLQTAVPALIMAIAGFMILNQLKIAEEIVTITYAALMGALGLGMALAFGLGGREVAADMLRGAYEENRDQVRDDFRQGRDRARVEADRARARMGSDGREEEPAEGDTVVAPYQQAETETQEDLSYQRSRDRSREPSSGS
jgi:Conserved TM helix